ncbi:MAG: NifU family protein [Patescibacteria group bacterium]|mgnify:CR=1 FL=1
MEEKVEVILKKVRPFIQLHGGDVNLVGIKKGVVTLRVEGVCVDCPLADLTYNKMVGNLIKEEVPGIKKVILI